MFNWVFYCLLACLVNTKTVFQTASSYKPCVCVCVCSFHHSRTFSLVSGSLRASSPPHSRAVQDRRMGMTVVTPTKEAKMELPKMAASLHTAFRRPNAVALQGQGKKGRKRNVKCIYHNNVFHNVFWNLGKIIGKIFNN